MQLLMHILKRRNAARDPLPTVIVLLTMTSGMLDAISFLELGQVFVGMMTGNVVVFGLALGGTLQFTGPAPLLAILGFMVGVASTAWTIRRQQAVHQRQWFVKVLRQEIMLLLTAALISWAVSPDVPAARSAIIGVLALAMGMRCVAIRRLAVPGLEATFALTGALIAALHDVCTGTPTHTLRRLGVIGATTAGAALGAITLTCLGTSIALLTVALTVALITAATVLHQRRQEKTLALAPCQPVT
ncbi:YoaK family protein [Streptomyces sp. NPDC090442]|uniref:YoaK family protein n=1 Tax=Streptomyces sp. NPDC090442 TaxID=3365962 RepID=UPI003811BA3F